MTTGPRLETLAVHAAASSDPTTGAVAPPIHLSTTFERSPDGTFPSGNTYIRDNNPNRRAVEACLAQLEGGASCLAFASGMAATMAVFQSLAPGDHVVAPEVAYYGTGKLLRDHFSGCKAANFSLVIDRDRIRKSKSEIGGHLLVQVNHRSVFPQKCPVFESVAGNGMAYYLTSGIDRERFTVTITVQCPEINRHPVLPENCGELRTASAGKISGPYDLPRVINGICQNDFAPSFSEEIN